MSLSSTKTEFVLNNGSKIPWIAYGTGTALYRQPAEKHVILALETGFTHIDTAEVYANEDSVGEGIQTYLSKTPSVKREHIYLVTKLNKVEPGKTVRDALVESLRKLKVSYVDLYLIHSPVPFKGRLKEVWKEFEAVQKEGLTKNIGVSNFRLHDFEEFISDATVIPAVNQIEFNPLVLKASEPLLEYHKKHNILTTAFGGLVPLTKKRHGPLDAELTKITQRLSKEHGKEVTETQVLIKWLLAKNVLPVTTSSKKSRLENLLETPKVPELTAAEITAIDEAGKQIHHRVFASHMDEK